MTSFQRISITGILIIAILWMFSRPSLAQEQNSTFVHGLFGGKSSLQKVADELKTDFRINPRRISYSSQNSIPTIASENHSQIQNDAVVVAHSMGGLVSRSMVDQFGTSKIDALITSGSPHNGVRAAISVQQGVVGPLLSHWGGDIAAGWLALGQSSIAETVVNNVLGGFQNWINSTVESKFDEPSVDDMRPTDSFLDNLNNNFDGTTPSATYAITGLEDWNSHWRLFGAFDDDREGNIIKVVNAYKYFYLSASFSLGFVAQYFFHLYNETGKWIYYDKYLFFKNASQAFFIGFDSLNRTQQLEWAWNITGAWNGPGTPLQRSDGLVPYTSQVPSPLRGTRELRALHTNHFELKARDNAIRRVRDAFRKNDVDVPEANEAPSASFTSSTSGLSAIFSNHSSDADGSIVAYNWDFGDGSTSTQANPSHYYSSEGTYSVTLTVTDDDGATASTTNSVFVSQDLEGGDCPQTPCPVLEEASSP